MTQPRGASHILKRNAVVGVGGYLWGNVRLVEEVQSWYGLWYECIHLLVGKELSTPERIEIKCPLNVWMALSVLLHWWMSCCMSRMLPLFLHMADLSSQGALL